MLRAAGWLCVAAGLCACRAGLPIPYTAAELRADSRERAGEALVHYLTQRGADVGVCDAEARTLARFDRADFAIFLDGIDARVAPPVWSACARLLAAGMRREDYVAALERTAGRLIERSDVRAPDERRIAVVAALAAFVSSRPQGVRLPEGIVPQLRARAEDPRVVASVREVMRTLHQETELERGRLDGAPVTSERLAAITDVALLRRAMARLPTRGMRRAARRRLIDIGIARSSMEWVREHADEVRERVLRTGRNALDLAHHTVFGARYVGPLANGTIWVEQDIAAQTSRLLYRLADETSVVPALDLSGALLFSVAHLDEPITLCSGASTLDVTPCIDARAISLDADFARIDRRGVLHFRDRMAPRELLELLTRGTDLEASLRLRDGEPLDTLRWPLRILPPPPVRYRNGEDLAVRGQFFGGRTVWRFHARGEPDRIAVVEAADLPRFGIVSRGRQGATGTAGAAGSAGAPGAAGMSASCPSSPGTSGGAGQSGGPGGNGGPGGPGGDGGDIDVTLECASDCEDVVQLARQQVRSEGGPGGLGGPGGPGGPGGAGGAGGSGGSCTTYSQQYDYSTSSYRSVPRTSYVGGGSQGPSGSRGPSGSPGPNGPAGSPGRVTIRLQPPTELPASASRVASPPSVADASR